MHSPGAAGPHERWQALVRVLHDDSDALVAEFLSRLRDVPPYGQGLVPMERVEEDARASFDYLLRRIGDLPLPRHLRGIGPSVGRDRARRGVPLEHLLTAVRLDFRVMWTALRRISADEDMPLLVDRAELVWGVVEAYTTEIQVSYLEETALMARERSRERSALVAGLLAQVDPDPQHANRVALALDVDPEADFLVAAAPSHDDRTLRAVADQLLASGRSLHVQETDRHTIVVLRWRGERSGSAHPVLKQARCGVAPVASGLRRVPGAARVATEVADVLPSGATGPHGVREAWAWAVAARLGALGPALADGVLGRMRRVHAGERKRLVQTALAFAECGSVQETAARLFCHRNTVLNRLRRFAELTGCDMTVPEQAALALVALGSQAPG